MSLMYYNYFNMCYHKEPPTVTLAQLDTAKSRGMLTEDEYNKIVTPTDLTDTPEQPPSE
jgi:hypothetical protein